MNVFSVILADGIDIPFVLMHGLAILIPLMAFQVVVESAVLSKVWNVKYRGLIRFVFRANAASLLAGIPTKILNSVIYGLLLPWNDLYVYFKRYPWVTAIGTGTYFIVTVGVESWYGIKQCRAERIPLNARRIWIGMLLANLATYAVLAPIHYHFTQPTHDVREFTADTAWARLPGIRIRFTEPETGEMIACRLDGLDRRLAAETERTAGARASYTHECEEWKALALIGLGSHVRIWRRDGDETIEQVIVAANPGLMHISGPRFERVQFLEGCDECVFEASDALYLMDIPNRRVGKITDGRDFVVLQGESP